jgi:thiol:disulfide interchange protein DsbC
MLNRIISFAFFVIFSGPVVAQTVPQAVLDKAATLIPDVLPDSVTKTPVMGLYEVVFGNQVVYLFSDGKYLLSGDLIDLDAGENLSENARKTGRKAAIDALDESGMVVFSPEETKSMITVFTDTECGYCVRLHNEISQVLAGGVKVRYLGYPRAGIGSSSHATLVSVWCADDPQQAMTDAKRGKAVEPRTCETDIEKHIDAARAVGVRGTPTIVLQDGKVIPGYVPAGELVPMANAAALN